MDATLALNNEQDQYDKNKLKNCLLLMSCNLLKQYCKASILGISINKSLSGLLLPSSCEWSTSKVSTVKKCPKTFNLKIVLRQAQLCQKAHIHGNRALGKMSMTNIEHVVGYQVETV